MDAYVINLDKRPDRWEQIQKDWADFPEVNLIRVSGIEHSSGSTGCAKSHLKIVQHAKDSELPCVLVLEDDAIPTEHFKKLWKRHLKFLDNHQDDWDIFNGGPTAVKGNNKKLSSILFKSDYTYASQFIIYNQCSYDKVLSWEDIPPKRPPIDLFFTSKYLNLRQYISFPYICIQRPGESNITDRVEDYLHKYEKTQKQIEKFMR